MSPKRIIALLENMGVNSGNKATIWRKTIENDKCSRLLLEKLVEKQITKKGHDDIDMTTDVDVRQESIKDYQW